MNVGLNLNLISKISRKEEIYIENSPLLLDASRPDDREARKEGIISRSEFSRHPAKFSIDSNYFQNKIIILVYFKDTVYGINYF